MKLAFVSTFTAIALVGLAGSQADAAPRGVKLSWASPDASRTMAVSWLTDTNLPSTIEYGISSVAENMLTGMPSMNIAGLGWHHEVELSGLQPNTTYMYRVGSAGDFSPQYTFTTAPADGCTPFEFVVLGDARSQDDRGPSRNWPSIQAEAHAAGARFFLNSGDLVKEGKEIDQWAAWIDVSAPINQLVPMMPAIGNHDDGPTDGDGANYNRIFVLPRNPNTGTEDYFHFVYSNLLVFSLSTATFNDWQIQADYVRTVSAQHPDKWSIVYFHHPVYTTATRLIVPVGHEPNERNQNPFFGPAFDDANVDLVVQSHNHHYERFRPLRYDSGDPEQGSEVPAYGRGPNEGRLYVVSGGSGAFLDPLIESSRQNLANGSESRSKDHHYIKIGIAGNTLHYSAVRTNAGNSSGGGMVIDQLTIARPGMDPCSTPMDPDQDMDGYPASMDCRDDDASINPGAAEICGNTADEDCSGAADDCPMPPVDADMDGSPADSDCDDADPNRFPSNPEVECDGMDQDCSGVDECPDAPDAGPGPAPDATTVAPDAFVGDDPAPAVTDAGDSARPAPMTIDSGNCGCRAAGHSTGTTWPAVFALLLFVFVRRRR